MQQPHTAEECTQNILEKHYTPYTLYTVVTHTASKKVTISFTTDTFSLLRARYNIITKVRSIL